MKLLNITKMVGIATIALAFTACGGGGSSSGGSTTPPPVQPAPDQTEPPLSDDGNPILLPGYEYNCVTDDLFELYAKEEGNIFVSSGAFYAFDSEFNEYNLNDTIGKKANTLSAGERGHLIPGQFYFTVINCSGTFKVQSNVLYDPSAQ